MNASIEKYRAVIKNQIDEEFESICNNILSENNINFLIQNVISMISNSEFKEDINMNLINDKDNYWNAMYEKNKIILNYFQQNKPGILDNLKERFISIIQTEFLQNLEKKILWRDFLKDSLVSIQKDINIKYTEMLNKCDYQEDLEKYIEKYDIFYEKILIDLKTKYFNNISEKRFEEAKNSIKNICKEEYIKILNNKLPIWENIKNDILSRIKENLDSYLFKIFNQKEFKDQINQNEGTKESFMNIIPLEIKENKQIKKSKENELNNYIESEIKKAINTFNLKKDKLPLFEDYLKEKIKLCSNKVDMKIKELLNKFHYQEDKIIFNSDSIFSFLTNNDEKIYENVGSKIEEMNYKLRELCDEKSKEYDSLILKTKPEWNIIKSEKISEIKKICENYGNKLDGVYFQEDIQKIDINNLKKRIIETPDLFKDVESCKKQEINNEIDKIINEEIIVKQNSLQKSLPNWSDIKMQLIDNIKFKMSIKSKNNLDYTNLNNVINVLCQYIETCSDIFNRCKTEEKKNEIRIETKNIAREIGQEYISQKQEEEKRRGLEEQKKIEEQQRRRLEEQKKREKDLILINLINQFYQREREKEEREQREQKEIKQGKTTFDFSDVELPIRYKYKQNDYNVNENNNNEVNNENIDDENNENNDEENIDNENNNDENIDDENNDDENNDDENNDDENNDDENNDDENDSDNNE